MVFAPQPGFSRLTAKISCSVSSGVFQGLLRGRRLRSVNGSPAWQRSSHLYPVRRVMPNSRHRLLKLQHSMAACANSSLCSYTVRSSHGILKHSFLCFLNACILPEICIPCLCTPVYHVTTLYTVCARERPPASTAGAQCAPLLSGMGLSINMKAVWMDEQSLSQPYG